MTHTILDYQGNAVGTVDLPDDMSQDDIDAQLNLYKYVPPSLTPVQKVASSIQGAISFGQGLIINFAAQNVLAGITQAGKTRGVADYLENVGYYLNSGSLYAAINEINSLIADTSDTKTGLSPFITNDILYTYLNSIQTYLCTTLTANPGS